MKIAYIGYQVQEKYTAGVQNDEDAELFAYLQHKGLNIQREIWNDPRVDWASYHWVVFKSPWDYHDDIVAFKAWLDRLDTLSVRALNSTAVVQWNCDKHYLQDIEKSGLKIVPSAFIERGGTFEQGQQYHDLFGVDQLVLKPCVSAGAKNTMIVSRDMPTEQHLVINTLLQAESYLVQPFIPEIKAGEWSLLFFNGQYSHSLLKTPKQGDFRVQHYLGGSISHQQASPALVDAAAAYVQAFAKGTLYARVDGVLINEVFHLMEIELIEPYLFLNQQTERFERYYLGLMGLVEE